MGIIKKVAVGGIALGAIGVVVIVLVVIAFVAGYFLFQSGVSVKWTAADLQSALGKLGTQRAIQSTSGPEGSIRTAGSHPVDTSLTSEEFTALQQSREYKYDPLYEKETNVRFNQDGTVESSGRIHTSNILQYGRALGISQGYLDLAKRAVDAIPADPTYYVKGTIIIYNNQVTSSGIDSLKIGGIPVPNDIINNNLGTAVNIADEALTKVPGVYVESLKIVDGKLDYKGTWPDKTYFSQ